MPLRAVASDTSTPSKPNLVITAAGCSPHPDSIFRSCGPAPFPAIETR